MSCASGGSRVPAFWKKRYTTFHEKRCMEIDWSDPDPASSLEDVTTNDMSNGNKEAVNRRKVNFSIFNFLMKEIKYPVADKDFPKYVVEPLERLRNFVSNGDLELEIFSNPKYNRYFKFGNKHVNYARANILNVGRILSSDESQVEKTLNYQTDEKNERVLKEMPSITVKNKSNANEFNTGDGKFDLNLKEIGEMQKEITRRLGKLMAIRRARRQLATKLRWEIKPSLNYELTKDLTSGGFDKIVLDVKKIGKKNPYHEIIRSEAMYKKLMKMENLSSDFIKGGELLRWGMFGAVMMI